MTAQLNLFQIHHISANDNIEADKLQEKEQESLPSYKTNSFNSLLISNVCWLQLSLTYYPRLLSGDIMNKNVFMPDVKEKQQNYSED